LASCVGKFQPKIDAVCDHGTISVGAEPFHVIHMSPMSDVVMRNSLLRANLCQANPIFGLQFAKAWQAASANFSPKLMLFVITAPYQLVLNDFMSSI
jgi:hypothetical protein